MTVATTNFKSNRKIKQKNTCRFRARYDRSSAAACHVHLHLQNINLAWVHASMEAFPFVAVMHVHASQRVLRSI